MGSRLLYLSSTLFPSVVAVLCPVQSVLAPSLPTGWELSGNGSPTDPTQIFASQNGDEGSVPWGLWLPRFAMD